MFLLLLTFVRFFRKCSIVVPREDDLSSRLPTFVPKMSLSTSNFFFQLCLKTSRLLFLFLRPSLKRSIFFWSFIIEQTSLLMKWILGQSITLWVYLPQERQIWTYFFLFSIRSCLISMILCHYFGYYRKTSLNLSCSSSYATVNSYVFAIVA